MNKKPFFRTFDGCWYAYRRVGAKRKQIKLKDREGHPIRGREREEDAFRAFCRFVASDPAHVPEPESLTVARVFDLFLSTVCPYEGSPPEKQPKAKDPRPPLKPNPPCEVRTYWWYRSYLQSFCDDYGRLPALKVKPLHVSRWLDSHPKWTSSRRCAVVALKRAYNWANDEGLLESNPLKKVRRPQARRRERIPTGAERQQILAAIKDEEFRQFVRAMQETGARPGEVRKVTAAQFREDIGAWVLPEHKTRKKTGRSRVIYLTPAMIELTRGLAAKWPQGPLFRGPKRKGCKPYSRNAIRCRFRRLRAKLPHLKGIVSYSYRHGFITDALERGVPVATVAELAGHTDLKMIQEHYGHLSEKRRHLQEAIRRATGCVEVPSGEKHPA
jgi:integrase